MICDVISLWQTIQNGRPKKGEYRDQPLRLTTERWLLDRVGFRPPLDAHNIELTEMPSKPGSPFNPSAPSRPGGPCCTDVTKQN